MVLLGNIVGAVVFNVSKLNSGAKKVILPTYMIIIFMRFL